MRQDIKINLQTSDIVLENKKQYQLRPFQWIDNPGGLSRYIYGEVTIPAIVSQKTIMENGFYVAIPYTPKYKEFKVRIKRTYSDTDFSYIMNPIDGTEWFTAQYGLYGGEMQNVFASQLKLLADNYYFCTINNGTIQFHPAQEMDFNISPCKNQNANMLLACVPTNNYRYPLAGVGLIRWVNGNLSKASLAERLMSEFNSDGVVVKNASYDYDTQHISLDLQEVE